MARKRDWLPEALAIVLIIGSALAMAVVVFAGQQ
jgi:hypothetical protein